MQEDPDMTVGTVATLAGVTIKTLHHYDEIGLVVAQRSNAGYRMYGSRQLDRLQEVLFFRELGFGLEEIHRIMTRPGYHRQSALERQRGLLERKAEHLLSMLDAIDRAIRAEQTGEAMTNQDKLEIFGDFDPSEHEEEAKQRWDATDAYQQSSRRVSQYTKDDWERIQAEVAAIYEAFVQLMDSGIKPASSEAAALVALHRTHISEWFYECTTDVHAGLGEMYVADPRFAANIDVHRTGLASFMSSAIAATYRL